MPEGAELIILMGVGGLFIILGIVGVLWGRSEERRYFEAISHKRDVREYLEHWPARPEPGAIKVGGWIAIAIGIVMLIVGSLFTFWL